MAEVSDLVDVERLLVGELQEVVGAQVSTELDADFDAATSLWLTLSRASSTEVDRQTGHLERVLVDFAAHGPSKEAAWELVKVACRELRSVPGAYELGVVTDVERVSGPFWSPDPTTHSPRYLCTWAITVHPPRGG